ncbi:MAG: YdcF family protein [Clostridia bacterium]|nr:YdcF family protein [Clostridia bacterium]
MKLDAILILGHRLLPNGKPSDDLKRRIERAVALYQETDASLVMPCGGITPGLDLTEAEVMRDMLHERGVPLDRIELEDRSRITIENVRNASKLLPESARVALVTSDYHMERALSDCKRAGIDTLGVPAETPAGEYRDRMFEKEKEITREMERFRQSGLTDEDIAKTVVEQIHKHYSEGKRIQ